VEEAEFKKLSANSRDWLIYSALSERSKEAFFDSELQAELDSGVNLEEQEKQAPKGETTVEETVTGKVILVTDKAVLIGNADRVAWFPKSVIINLDKIALKQGEIVELKIVDWFKYKIEWKVPTQ